MSFYNFILNEFSGKNFLINLLIIVLALQQNDLKKMDIIIATCAIFIFKLIVFYLNREHFTDEPISYNYFLPHFYNDSLKRKSLSDNYKLYTPSYRYNKGKLDEIKLYEPTNNEKYLKLNNKEEYNKKNIKFKKINMKNIKLKKSNNNTKKNLNVKNLKKIN